MEAKEGANRFQGSAFKISLSETDHFERDGFSGDVYVPTDAGLGFNALQVDVHGRHYRTRMKDATRMYLVLEGEGTFSINQEAYSVKKGDLFVIGNQGEYEYQGNMKLVEINVPGTTRENEDRFD